MTSDGGANPDMMCVKYVSRSLIGGDLGALERLRQTCHRLNALRGISGALYYDAMRFFQVLEGERRELEALIAQISIDPRHADMRILESHNLPDRVFGAWNMKFVSGLSHQPPDVAAADLFQPGQEMINRMTVYLLGA